MQWCVAVNRVQVGIRAGHKQGLHHLHGLIGKTQMYWSDALLVLSIDISSVTKQQVHYRQITPEDHQIQRSAPFPVSRMGPDRNRKSSGFPQLADLVAVCVR